MSEILVGTSGYSYKDWKGGFYPTRMPEKDFLGFYAKNFRVLELNFSYYRMPQSSLSWNMIRKSGEELVFIVKAFRGLTHEINDDSLNKTLPLFVEGITPFFEMNRLGGVLLQFPQSFHYRPKNRIYLKTLIESLPMLPLFVEFRHREWMRDSVFTSLRDLGAGLVCVDEPPLPSLMPPLTINTTSEGYIRFHGRNKMNWYNTDSKARYDYLYSDDELREWVQKIREMEEKTDRNFVFFNNHAKAHAITNAKMLINLLK